MYDFRFYQACMGQTQLVCLYYDIVQDINLIDSSLNKRITMWYVLLIALSFELHNFLFAVFPKKISAYWVDNFPKILENEIDLIIALVECVLVMHYDYKTMCYITQLTAISPWADQSCQLEKLLKSKIIG
jgi:hypothetical protein